MSDKYEINPILLTDTLSIIVQFLPTEDIFNLFYTTKKIQQFLEKIVLASEIKRNKCKNLKGLRNKYLNPVGIYEHKVQTSDLDDNICIQIWKNGKIEVEKEFGVYDDWSNRCTNYIYSGYVCDHEKLKFKITKEKVLKRNFGSLGVGLVGSNDSCKDLDMTVSFEFLFENGEKKLKSKDWEICCSWVNERRKDDYDSEEDETDEDTE